MFTSSKNEYLFFDQFNQTLDDTCTAAGLLQDLLCNYVNIDEKIAAIEKLEHKCDVDVHTIIKHVNNAFITPIDREDILLIAKEIDNITDNIESTAHRFKLFNIDSIRPVAFEMMDLIIRSTQELRVVFQEFRHMKTSKILHEKVIEVNRLENQADEVYRGAIHNLFLHESDPIALIKWKEIYEYMEKSIDACEDMANIVEGIVTKNV